MHEHSPIPNKKPRPEPGPSSTSACISRGKKNGGLGSSHTAPCGAAVPARPPTRSSDLTRPHPSSPWAARLIPPGTRVVVHLAPLTPNSQYSSPAECAAALASCRCRTSVRPSFFPPPSHLYPLQPT